MLVFIKWHTALHFLGCWITTHYGMDTIKQTWCKIWHNVLLACVLALACVNEKASIMRLMRGDEFCVPNIPSAIRSFSTGFDVWSTWHQISVWNKAHAVPIWALILYFLSQVLGPKSSIAPATPDDEEVETSNKKKAGLYMVIKTIISAYILAQFWIFTYLNYLCGLLYI